MHETSIVLTLQVHLEKKKVSTMQRRFLFLCFENSPSPPNPTLQLHELDFVSLLIAVSKHGISYIRISQWRYASTPTLPKRRKKNKNKTKKEKETKQNKKKSKK